MCFLTWCDLFFIFFILTALCSSLWNSSDGRDLALRRRERLIKFTLYLPFKHAEACLLPHTDQTHQYQLVSGLSSCWSWISVRGEHHPATTRHSFTSTVSLYANISDYQTHTTSTSVSFRAPLLPTEPVSDTTKVFRSNYDEGWWRTRSPSRSPMHKETSICCKVKLHIKEKGVLSVLALTRHICAAKKNVDISCDH